MKGLTFEKKIVAYLLTGVLSGIRPQVVFSSWPPVQMREIEEPRLIGPDWVTIKPRLSGFCGSDLGTILCHESPTMEPFPSFPCVLGHEVCGDIAVVGDGVRDFSPGDRVTVMPVLGCEPRRIDPPCRMCAQGRYQLCENLTGGSLAAGMYVGICADAPGFISEMGVAHVSQLYKVPAGVSDENAVLTEPFSTALHMVIANPIQAGETVMVVGHGVMGLCTIAALRALHPDIRIIGVEIDPFHSEVAKDMGVDEVIRPGGKRFYKQVAELTGAKMYTPTITQPILIGGVDRVFDAVGSTASIHAALRVIANGGWYNLLGISKVKKIDWTPVWFKELTLRGIYAYQDDVVAGEKMHDFELALKLYAEGTVDLARLVTHRFTLDEWHKALDTAMNKGRERAIKIVFTNE